MKKKFFRFLFRFAENGIRKYDPASYVRPVAWAVFQVEQGHIDTWVDLTYEEALGCLKDKTNGYKKEDYIIPLFAVHPTPILNLFSHQMKFYEQCFSK